MQPSSIMGSLRFQDKVRKISLPEQNTILTCKIIGNNMYVFPGIGLGTILSKATTVTQSMIYTSATSLSASLLPSEVSRGWLYPELSRIRDVSVIVAMGVIRAAQEAGVDREQSIKGMADDELEKWVRSKMYDPSIETVRIEEEVQNLVDVSKKGGSRGANL